MGTYGTFTCCYTGRYTLKVETDLSCSTEASLWADTVHRYMWLAAPCELIVNAMSHSLTKNTMTATKLAAKLFKNIRRLLKVTKIETATLPQFQWIAQLQIIIMSVHLDSKSISATAMTKQTEWVVIKGQKVDRGQPIMRRMCNLALELCIFCIGSTTDWLCTSRHLSCSLHQYWSIQSTQTNEPRPQSTSKWRHNNVLLLQPRLLWTKICTNVWMTGLYLSCL